MSQRYDCYYRYRNETEWNLMVERYCNVTLKRAQQIVAAYSANVSYADLEYKYELHRE